MLILDLDHVHLHKKCFMLSVHLTVWKMSLRVWEMHFWKPSWTPRHLRPPPNLQVSCIYMLFYKSIIKNINSLYKLPHVCFSQYPRFHQSNSPSCVTSCQRDRCLPSALQPQVCMALFLPFSCSLRWESLFFLVCVCLFWSHCSVFILLQPTCLVQPSFHQNTTRTWMTWAPHPPSLSPWSLIRLTWN